MAKVIHVHLTQPIEETTRKDWYFSSIKAVFSVFAADQVGATYNYLRHAGLTGNGTVITKRAIIKQSTLISGGGGADYKDGVLTALEGKYNGILGALSTLCR